MMYALLPLGRAGHQTQRHTITVGRRGLTGGSADRRTSPPRGTLGSYWSDRTNSSSSTRIRRSMSSSGSGDLVRGFAGRVSDIPVQVAFARIDRAVVATAHRDHSICCAHDLVDQRLGNSGRHPDRPQPGRRPRYGDPPGRSRPSGAHMDFALRVVVQQCRITAQYPSTTFVNHAFARA
jgi:hypothetical protein